MPKMAVCRGPWKQVENIIMAEEGDVVPFNCVLIEVPDGDRCQEGMIFWDGHFKWPEGISDGD